VTVADRRDEMAAYQPEALKADLCESPPEIVKNDVIQVSPREPTLITDVRFDHPTSIPVPGVADYRKTQCSEEVLPIGFSRNTQEVLGCVAEPEPEELEVDYGMSSGDDANREKAATSEEAEVELANKRAAGCCTSNADFSEPNMDFRKSDTHVQHMAGPGSAGPDEDCGASDVDTTGSRKSMDLRKPKEEKVQHETDTNKVSSFNKRVKKANVRFRSGRGVKQKLIQEVNPPTGSRCGAKKSTKPPKPITVREIFESLRLFNQELQRDLSDEEDLHGLGIVDPDAEEAFDEIDFWETFVISRGPTPETAPETALPTTSSELGINRERRSGTAQRSTEQRKI